MTQSFPEFVTLMEVGPRDGLQNQSQYVSVEQKLALIGRSIEAGVKRIQVTSFVHPRLVPQMADAEAVCAGLPALAREDVLFNGLVLNLRGLERAHAAGLNYIDTGVPASEALSQKNANSTIEEGMRRMTDILDRARVYGMRVRMGVQTAFGCVYEGAIPQARVVKLCERFLAMGIDELTIADSAGLANPRQVKHLLNEIIPMAGNTPVVLHLHDTRGMGIANLYAALECGVRYFDSAFGGLGGCPFIKGAKGNIATEDSINMLHAMGVETGIDIKQVSAISRDLEQLFGQALPAKMHRFV
ncbi:MAG: hydroxymethylglutaryl-CoA lyase [Candidatus Promineifilaceae bacterium]